MKSRAVLFVTIIITLSLPGLHRLCNKRYPFSIASPIPNSFLSPVTLKSENPCNWQKKMSQTEASKLEIESEDLRLEN